MRKALIVVISISLLSLAPLVQIQPAAAQTLCTSFSDFTAANGWSFFGTDYDNVVIGETVTVNGAEIVRAMASYDIEEVMGHPRGVSSVSYAWLYYGAPSLYEGIATATITIRNAQVAAYQHISGVSYVPQWHYVTESFSNVAVDHFLVYVEAAHHPEIEQLIEINVSQICYYSELVTPTPIFTSTATATRTETPTLTPSITDTPVTETPTPSLTPTDTTTPATPVSTLTPTYDMTLSSGGFATPVPPSDDCRDLLNPCPIFLVPILPPFELPSPTALEVGYVATPTLIASFTLSAAAQSTAEAIDMDLRPLASSVADVIGANDAQGTLVVNNALGTPVDFANTARDMGITVGNVFGITRALEQADLGRWWPIFVFMLLLLAFNVLTRVSLLFVPIIAALFKLLMQFIQLLVTVFRALWPL